MIGYVTVGTNDMERATAFYDALAKELDTPRMMDFPGFIVWGRPGVFGGFALAKPHDKQPATVGNGVMVAFAAKDKAQVDRIYAIARENGATCEGPPGPRSDTYYGAYFRDLDGNKLNAFYMG